MTTIVNGTSGVTFSDSSVQNTAAIGFRNRIINGAMVIDQRNAGASVTPANDAYMTDRWKYGGSQASKFTAQQVSTAPTGFINSLKMTVASAVTVGASDYFAAYQPIEGLNISDLAWGTASAAPITLSFWVYSSLTGTFGGALRNSGGTRSYPFTYTISSANTWEQKTVTIAGDTSGTWLTTTGIGISVQFSLGTGSTLSGTANTWAGANYLSATGAVSVVGTSSATWYITGVQFEKGTTASSFDFRSYGQELALCQRYYEMSYSQGVVLGTVTQNGMFGSLRIDSLGGNSLNFKVTKRTAPTVTGYSPETGTSGKCRNYSTNSDVNIQFVGISDAGYYTVGGTTVGNGFGVQWTASAEL